MEAGMQSQVLALATAKNAVLAHATAAQLVAATMTNKQNQHNRKHMLMKEFTDDIGGGSMDRAIEKKRIERYRKKKANNAAANDLEDDDDSMEPDSQESPIKSILECKDNIGNLDGIHVQQKELLGSTLHDVSIIGKC
jgi:acetyl-CoA carboxylase carboxyltransferase component